MNEILLKLVIYFFNSLVCIAEVETTSSLLKLDWSGLDAKLDNGLECGVDCGNLGRWIFQS